MRNGYFGIGICTLILVGVVAAFNLVGAFAMAFAMIIDPNAETNGSLLIIINAFAQLSIMLTVPIAIVRVRNMNPQAIFRIEGIHDTPLMAMLIGVPMIIVAQIFASGVDGLWVEFVKLFPEPYKAIHSLQQLLDDTMGDITTAHSPGELIILLIGISLVPSVVEETFFRGFVQTNIERSGKGKPRPYLAIVITSLLFGAMHLSPLNLFGLASIGAVLGWLAYRTSDLRVSMLAHAMSNGLIVLSTYFFQGSKESVDALTGSPDISTSDSLMMIGISLPMLIGLLYIFQKLSAPLRARDNAAREIGMIYRHILPKDNAAQ